MDGDEILARADLQRAVRRRADVEVDVRLVGDHHETVLAGQRQQLLVVRARRAGAGRIVRVAVEPDRRLAPLVDGDRVEIRQERAVGSERVRPRRAAREQDRPLVDRISRVRVPADRPVRVQRDERQVEERLLRAGARQDLGVRVQRERKAPLEISGHRLAQRGSPRDRRVLRDVRHRLPQRLADERRRRLARIADAEVVDRPARANRRLALHERLFLQVPRELLDQRVQRCFHSARTSFLRIPTPPTSISTTSPGLIGPTPAGVPVETRSPASSVIPAAMNESRRGRGKIWSFERPFCFTAPLTRQMTGTSDHSRPTVTHGPTGQKVSNPFARVHWASARWMSRQVTSFRQVTPAIALTHSASDALRSRLPITTASSASWWTSFETESGGSTIACPWPISPLGGFMKISGSFGTSDASSFAWSR